MPITSPTIRPATLEDLPILTRIWTDGWAEAHADHVPAELTAIRTEDSFRIRLTDYLESTCVSVTNDHVTGLCIVKANEIYQMFVSPAARGTGAAAALMADGESRIRKARYDTATLDVIPENLRAIAFYKKCGWQQGQIETVTLDTLDAPFLMPCLIMTKSL